PSVKTASGRSCWTVKPTAVCPSEVSRRIPSGSPARGSARRGTGEVNPRVVWPTTKFSAATPLRDLSFLSAPGFESFPHQEEGHAEGCYRVGPPPPKRGVQRAPSAPLCRRRFPPRARPRRYARLREPPGREPRCTGFGGRGWCLTRIGSLCHGIAWRPVEGGRVKPCIIQQEVVVVCRILSREVMEGGLPVGNGLPIVQPLSWQSSR